MLHNKTYTGSIIYNIKDKKGKITETIVMKNAHEAIITKEQFNFYRKVKEYEAN
nr:recombinase family protein [uncultured Bacillus sp.]